MELLQALSLIIAALMAMCTILCSTLVLIFLPLLALIPSLQMVDRKLPSRSARSFPPTLVTIAAGLMYSLIGFVSASLLTSSFGTPATLPAGLIQMGLGSIESLPSLVRLILGSVGCLATIWTFRFITVPFGVRPTAAIR